MGEFGCHQLTFLSEKLFSFEVPLSSLEHPRSNGGPPNQVNEAKEEATAVPVMCTFL